MQNDNAETTGALIERRRFAATIGGVAVAATGTLMSSSSALAQNSATVFPHTLVEGALFTGPRFPVSLANASFEGVLNVFGITGDSRREILQAFAGVLQMLTNPTTAVAIQQAVLGVNTAITAAQLPAFVSATVFGMALAAFCSLICPAQPSHGNPNFQYYNYGWELVDIDLSGITAICFYRCFGRS